MHLLVISLLIILTGTLLLAKFKKEQAGRLFIWISWFFIIVGLGAFIHFAGNGIWRMTHHGYPGYLGHPGLRQEMMMKQWHHGMKGCFRCPMQREKCCGMSAEVPPPVNEAFSMMFPAATDVKNKMEGEEFEFNFKDKDIEMSANFDATGKWLETETGMKESDMPKEISASIAKNFAGYKITEAEKVEEPGKDPCYQLELKKGDEVYDVRFSPKGVILEKNPVKQEQEENDKD
jgi:hypothetical protein